MDDHFSIALTRVAPGSVPLGQRTLNVRGPAEFDLGLLAYLGATTKNDGEGFEICALFGVRDFGLAVRTTTRLTRDYRIHGPSSRRGTARMCLWRRFPHSINLICSD